jgi:RNAse (barnase) inhibitor barstar
MVVLVDAREITDWDSFHDVFARVFGFLEGYGRNMNAWIDCMISLEMPEDGMTTVHVQPGETLRIHLEYSEDFRKRCPEIVKALVDCVEFVNEHRSPPLALTFEA